MMDDGAGGGVVCYLWLSEGRAGYEPGLRSVGSAAGLDSNGLGYLNKYINQ